MCLELALTPYSFIFCWIIVFYEIGAKLISNPGGLWTKLITFLVPLFDSTSIEIGKSSETFRNVHLISWKNKHRKMGYLKICIQILFVCKSLSSNDCLFEARHPAVTEIERFSGSSNFHNNKITLNSQVCHEVETTAQMSGFWLQKSINVKLG